MALVLTPDNIPLTCILTTTSQHHSCATPAPIPARRRTYTASKDSATIETVPAEERARVAGDGKQDNDDMTAEYTRIPSVPGVPGVRPCSLRRWVVRIALALAAVVVLHYAALGFRAQHMAPRQHAPVVTEDVDAIFADLVSRPSDRPAPTDSIEPEGGIGIEGEEGEGGANEGEEDGLSAETLKVLAELPRGPYVKDTYPIRTMRAFLDLAELEIKRAGVDTCRDRLGVPLIREWAQTGKTTCKSSHHGLELRSSITPADAEVTGTHGQTRDAARLAVERSEEKREVPETHKLEPGSITCFNPKDGRGASWWAMGSYPCISAGLQTSGNASRFATPLDCTLPRSREKYALANLLHDHTDTQCKDWVNVTTFIVHRRDEWNP